MPLIEYQGFWRWFQTEVLPTLARREVPNQEMIRELDTRIVELGLLWELGPATEGEEGWAFAISFGADLDRLSEAKAMFDAAPSMEQCQVLLGKPPKQWSGVLELNSRWGTTQFHTANWWCYILQVEGGMAIMVAPSTDSDTDEEVLEQAAAIAVQSELGELHFAERIRYVLVVSPELASNHHSDVRCRMSELRAMI